MAKAVQHQKQKVTNSKIHPIILKYDSEPNPLIRHDEYTSSFEQKFIIKGEILRQKTQEDRENPEMVRIEEKKKKKKKKTRRIIEI